MLGSVMRSYHNAVLSASNKIRFTLWNCRVSWFWTPTIAHTPHPAWRVSVFLPHLIIDNLQSRSILGSILTGVQSSGLWSIQLHTPGIVLGSVRSKTFLTANWCSTATAPQYSWLGDKALQVNIQSTAPRPSRLVGQFFWLQLAGTYSWLIQEAAGIFAR